jgi:hypothetical protein
MKIPVFYWVSPSFWYAFVKEILEKRKHPLWYFKVCPSCGFFNSSYVEHCMRCLHSNKSGWDIAVRDTRLFQRGFITFDEYSKRIEDNVKGNVNK